MIGSLARLPVALLVCACACGVNHGAPLATPQMSGPTTSAAGPPESARRPQLPDTDWRWLSSTRHRIELPIPDGRSWEVDDASSSWLVATHRESSSTLSLKTWRADSVVNRADCEHQVRKLHKPLPSADVMPIAERIANQPPGFDTRVTLAVHPGHGIELEGTLLAFGANIRQCLVLVFVTRASGPGAKRVLADRLALVDRRVVEQMRRRTVEDRADSRPSER